VYEVLLVALSVVAGGIAAVAGFGIGSVLTPALALSVGTKVAVALVAIPHFAATALRLWVLRRSVDRGVLVTFGLASAAGGLGGAVLHSFLASPVLSIVLGLLLVFGGLSELLGLARRFRVRTVHAIAGGALSGLFGGLVGNQGGIRSAALLRFDLRPRALIATATASALLVDVARVPVYVVSNGDDLLDGWLLVTFLAVGVVVGTLIGAPVLGRIPERLFRRVLAVLLIGLGASLIVGAAL
jgi:uncharacterized membrane protein YfcA